MYYVDRAVDVSKPWAKLRRLEAITGGVPVLIATILAILG